MDITDSNSEPGNADAPSSTPPGSEQRGARREKLSSLGRLAYGGEEPRVLSCEVLDMSETGVRVETYVHPSQVPEFVSLEFGGIYYRARRRWVDGNQLGLELIQDET
ncbi:MAG: PilZ domain-containing protein [Acidocella sp.]|nr:PilZ domain-containing protein [Acidocella sp.]